MALNVHILAVKYKHLTVSFFFCGKPFCYFFIYASVFHALRRILWSFLSSFSSSIGILWSMVGDFNDIFGSHEKCGKLPIAYDEFCLPLKL